ncbi:MAG: hypothetical protein JWO38_1250 [Gemmataceae bacterium]|nr:hypothetical protein [Gemmataceae bacterium]
MLQATALSATELADFFGDLHGSGLHTVSWCRDRIVVGGRTGYDHYRAVRTMVGELVDWASTNGFRVESMGTSSVTGHTWVLTLIPRKLLAARCLPPARCTYDEADADGDAERVRITVDQLWAETLPRRTAEDEKQRATYPMTPAMREQMDQLAREVEERFEGNAGA